MRVKSRNILAIFVSVGILAISTVLALGNYTWAPSVDVTARQGALIVDPLVLPEQRLLQETVGEPSQELLAALYERVLPSIVNIQVTANLRAESNFGLPSLPAQGQGSGWVWDADGHIVTNNHVVENASEITVFFYNGLWAAAEVVATDPQADLAVIQVDAPDGVELVPLPLAAEVPPVGHYALAFGSPFGLFGTMTKGIISARGRSFPVGDATTSGSQYSLPDVIQTDAAINPGNSGGPLVNLTGEVLGVNFAIRSEVRANSGVGFAIPVPIIARVVPALIETGAYAYPYLGMSGGTITPQIAEQEEIPDGILGVFVGTVAAGGPSAAAGLQPGDVITAIDGQSVAGFEDLIAYLITEREPGDKVELLVLRDGDTLTLSVTLGERPNTAAQQVRQVTVGQAIDTASEAALDAELLPSVDSASAIIEDFEGRNAWVVTLESGELVVKVVIDTENADVLDMAVVEPS